MSTSSPTLSTPPAAAQRRPAAPEPAGPQDIRPAQDEAGEAAPPAFTGLRHPRDAHRVSLEFSGSGGEYFRIWIVNLLLTLLTLGLYRPWARVRRLRYFYTNTHVAGHGLDFHGRPGQMLRGMLLAGVLLGVYAVAQESSSALAGGLALAAALLLWPPMLRASLQFRLAHTSWRGLRFGFDGTLAGAYRAVGLPMVLFVLLPLATGLLLMLADPDPAKHGALAAAGLALLPLSLMLLGLPYFHWRLMQYRQGHYRLGGLNTELRLGPGRVYRLYLRTLALALLVPLAAAVLAAAALAVLSGSVPGAMLATWGPGASLLGVLYLYAGVGSYFTVGLQNLVWSRTGNRYLRLRSELALPPYLLLQFKNLLLLALTLGLYWPWAAVARYRMRLEAVTLVSRVELEELRQALQPGGGLAVADAAGDLLGLDLGV